MTRTEARSIGRWFQRKVGLAGWTIRVSLGAIPNELAKGDTPEENEGHLGISDTHLRLHEMSIWVNPNPVLVSPLDTPDKTITLMHELLHGLFESVDIAYNKQHEHPIDRLAHVLAAQYKWQQRSERRSSSKPKS